MTRFPRLFASAGAVLLVLVCFAGAQTTPSPPDLRAIAATGQAAPYAGNLVDVDVTSLVPDPSFETPNVTSTYLTEATCSPNSWCDGNGPCGFRYIAGIGLTVWTGAGGAALQTSLCGFIDNVNPEDGPPADGWQAAVLQKDASMTSGTISLVPGRYYALTWEQRRRSDGNIAFQDPNHLAVELLGSGGVAYSVWAGVVDHLSSSPVWETKTEWFQARPRTRCAS